MNKYIGDRKFYKKIMYVAVPIMIQNGMTNFVNFLDNMMVGRLGTEQMTGVAIVNQIIFVFNLCIFGAISGAGIFSAQYFGKKDINGVRNTFRYKMWITTIILSIAIAIFIVRGSDIIMLYLKTSSEDIVVADTLIYGKKYLGIMIFGMPAFIITQLYASTLREAGETVVPMAAGVSAVVTDCLLNYVLIYGKLGCPALGVEGAAVATTIARYIESFIVVFWTHFKKEKFEYIKGMYRTIRVPFSLLVSIIKRGAPLLVNETLWALGMAILVQCYSVRGVEVVAGINISNTISNLFNIVFFAMGDCIAIIVGQLLGSGKMEEARDSARKMIVFAVGCSALVAIILFSLAPVLPELYKVTDMSKEYATRFMKTASCFMPMIAFLHATYFTLRSGGKTIITFLFDSVFMCLVSVPAAYCLSRFTDLDVLYIFISVNLLDLIKCIIGYILVKKGVWINNIVDKNLS